MTCRPRNVVVLLTLSVCFSVFVGLRLHRQNPVPNSGQGPPKAHAADHASQLAGEKMELSKLDWIMLTARVRLLEQIVAHVRVEPLASRRGSAVTMYYDRDRERVVVGGYVDPDWIRGAKTAQVKKVLLQQGASYCVDGLAMAEGEANEVLAAMNIGDDCSVEFFTVTVDKTGHLTKEDIATEEHGYVVIK